MPKPTPFDRALCKKASLVQTRAFRAKGTIIAFSVKIIYICQKLGKNAKNESKI
jgi:hypothetical protein